jgi:DNA repair exonuclease SbcCD ATPase subunit
MILESIELTYVGPFRQTVRIGPLPRGLNVLAAYNEEGKTTVVRATVRALFDRHTGKSEEIRYLQPVGTSLAPAVTVVFHCGGAKFRTHKIFLNAPRSELDQWRDARWERVAEGDAADNRLHELLRSEEPGKGASKPEHWGLFQYLWARQGERAAWPSWDGEAGKVVRARLARIELDPLIEQLKSALTTEYEAIFTPQGKPKAHGPLEGAEAELGRLNADLEVVRPRQRQLEDSQTRFQQLGEQLTILEAEAKQKRADAGTIAKHAAEAERLLVEVEAKQTEFEAARTGLHAVEKDIAGLALAEMTVTGLNADIERLQFELRKLTEWETALTNQQNDAGQAEHQLQTARTKIQMEVDRIVAVLKLRRAFAELKPLRDRLEETEKRNTEVARLEEQKSTLPAVTPQKLKRLEERESSVRQLNAQIEVIGISVELTPDKAGEVEVTESGKKRRLILKSGRTETLKSGEAVRLRLSTWGTIRVRSGATELRELQQQLAQQQRELGKELTELGLKSAAGAAGVLETRRGLDAALRETRNELKRALGDFDDSHSLQHEINRCQHQLQSLDKSVQPTKHEQSAPLAELEAREEKLRAELRSADDKLRRQAEQVKSLADQLTTCRHDRAQLDKERSVLNERLNNTQAQIDQIRKRYPAGLDAGKSKAQREFVEAEARLKATRAKLPPDAEKLPERNRRAAKAAADAEEALQGARTQRDELAGTLRALGAEGIYSRETELLEKIALCRAAADASRRRGSSARLIRDLLVRRKQAATRAVLAPLQEKISATFAELTADHARKVYLDENLQIRGVGCSETELLPFELLSQGAREQLLLALRVAVADAVADSEPQLLILDDVLVNTDPVRQERVLDLLQSAAQRLQILVLTCHSDRYRGIGNQVTIQTAAGWPCT